jgi:hypothetical protein
MIFQVKYIIYIKDLSASQKELINDMMATQKNNTNNKPKKAKSNYETDISNLTILDKEEYEVFLN